MGNESSTIGNIHQEEKFPSNKSQQESKASIISIPLQEKDGDNLLDDSSSTVIVNNLSSLSLAEVSSVESFEEIISDPPFNETNLQTQYSSTTTTATNTITDRTLVEEPPIPTDPQPSTLSHNNTVSTIIMPKVNIKCDFEDDGDCDQQDDSYHGAFSSSLSHDSAMIQPLLIQNPSWTSSSYKVSKKEMKNHPLPDLLLRSRKGSKSDPDLLTQQHILLMKKTKQRNNNDNKKKKKNSILPLTTLDLNTYTTTTSIQSSSSSFSSPSSSTTNTTATPIKESRRLRKCWYHSILFYHELVKNTLVCMNILAKILFWVSLLCLIIGVVWYSMELHEHGTDPHLIAWFSAGAFVILGFPISMYGIIMQLSNYFQPNIQCYVVRILWIVPFYSIESWLSLRFHRYALYIQTLRDCYESYVLYCFLQYLIEVLGGEDALINLLKDKSPTRGVHFPPLNWCMKPWIMGQPVSKAINASVSIYTTTKPTSSGGVSTHDWIDHTSSTTSRHPSSSKYSRIQWTSPFFVQCKFGVLQYVLLKFISALFVVVLEKFGWYKEGDFTHKGGYLYICILTNTSQCWALYCLVFFYYATKNQLSPIRPVGKFLSVKALVFFTWWQSVLISILFYYGFIKPYKNGEWSAEAVAKGIQDYMICVELFFFAIAHIFVFPHTDYLQPLNLDGSSMSETYMEHRKRLGRNRKYTHTFNHHQYGRTDDKSTQSKNSSVDGDFDMSSLQNGGDDKYSDKHRLSRVNESWGDVELSSMDKRRNAVRSDPMTQSPKRTGFVRALLDSAVPRDVMDNTVGLARGDYNVEKKTLLSHAAASDEYNLFANTKFRRSSMR